MIPSLAVAAALLTSLLAPTILRVVLRRMNVIDTPNSRSSHFRPTIRGGGLGPLFALVIAYALAISFSQQHQSTAVLVVIAATTTAAGLLGWIEDVWGVPVPVRALAQLIIGLCGATAITMVFDLPWPFVVIGFVVVIYTNAANFMDGINGISGFHGLVVGVAYAGIGLSYDLAWLSLGGLVIAAVFVGFLPWNLFGPGYFLGDVGSYLLGGGIAILAIAAFAAGASPLALASPLAIYLADVGITLMRRLVNRERWYEPHRTHAYQRLVADGMSHFQATVVVTLASAMTATIGYLSIEADPIRTALCGIAMIVIVVAYFGFAAIVRSRVSTHPQP